MKAFRQSGKRILGGVVVSTVLVLAAVAPTATHAAASAHTTALGIPKRCQPIMSEIQNLSPADFPNQQAFQNALRALMSELHACEQHYGK